MLLFNTKNVLFNEVGRKHTSGEVAVWCSLYRTGFELHSIFFEYHGADKGSSRLLIQKTRVSKPAVDKRGQERRSRSQEKHGLPWLWPSPQWRKEAQCVAGWLGRSTVPCLVVLACLAAGE